MGRSRKESSDNDNSASLPFNSSSVQSLRRVFSSAFLVHDIAEPLVSFDDSVSSRKIRAFMESNRFEVVGVRRKGLVSGYIELADLGADECGKYLKPFDETHVILDSSPLVELVLRLRDCRRLFVSLLGQVGGIVSRSDLQKPPARMWLFGMVTLIEMRFNRLIDQYCPDESWRPYLSPGRIQKARELLAERIRLHQDLKLLDCLQLSDKAQIMARDEKLRSITRFESKRQLENTAKMLQKLRNNLAHSQDIVTSDWETIVFLSENLDRVLDGPKNLQE